MVVVGVGVLEHWYQMLTMLISLQWSHYWHSWMAEVAVVVVLIAVLCKADDTPDFCCATSCAAK